MKFLQYSFYFILTFVIFFIAGFYAYYKYKYSSGYTHYFKSISWTYTSYPRDIILKTGARLEAPQTRLQHFLNFPAKKRKGVIRIGAFGDSYTYGAEVEKTSTYPYYLQKLFEERFPKQTIEVLNFGISGSSLIEQFFLWEKYAKIYQLDYILVGPAGFYSHRYTGFTFGNPHFDYLKERFILTQKHQLKKVHIKGETLKDRFKNYYKLIPQLDTLRYDKQAFTIYEILLPFLAYKINNPFYYTKMSEKEESIQINKGLLEKINKLYPKKMLVFTHEAYIYDQYKSFNSLYNLYKPSSELYSWNLITPTNNFYKVFNHESSLGNEFTAHFYFNALLGNKTFFINKINCYFKDKKRDLNHNRKNLDTINYIEVLGENTRLFNLRKNWPFKNPARGIYKQKTKSFLTFLNKNNFLKSVYIPLPFQLKEGMKIYIQFKNDKKIELGSILSLDNYNKFFAFYKDYITSNFDYTYTPHWFIYFLKEELKQNGFDIEKNPAELFIENYKLGLLNPDSHKRDSWKLILTNGYSETFLMVGPHSAIKEENFPKEFDVYLRYETAGGDSLKSLIPDWTCKKEKLKINLDLPHFDSLKF